MSSEKKTSKARMLETMDIDAVIKEALCMALGKEETSVPKSMGKICVPHVGNTSPKKCIHF